MSDRRGVILMGLRGSGKSTIGPGLAQLQSLPFVDLDRLTLERAGAADVRSIVEAAGWEAFREHELRALSGVLAGPVCVLALGGGTPTHEPSRDALRLASSSGRATIVYLRAKPETLAARMQATPDRPSLTGADPFHEIAVLFDARDPAYLELADLVIETDRLSLTETAERVALSL
ncbi:MAG: shikimate kinase [Phycisphaerales bacterium]